MKKRILTIITIGALSLTAAGCSCSQPATVTPSGTDPVETTTEAPAPETTKAPEPETTPAPETTAEPEQTAEATEPAAPEQTNAPAVTEPAEEKGCGGFVAGGIALVAILGTALIIKKKD